MIEYAIWGGVGGLLSLLTKNGCIELPKVREKKLYLGGLQGILFGVVAGIIGDSSPVNAFFWGAGSSAMLAGMVQFAERKLGGGMLPPGIVSPSQTPEEETPDESGN